MTSRDMLAVKKLFVTGELFRLLRNLADFKSMQSTAFYEQILVPDNRDTQEKNHGLFVSLMISEIRFILDEYEQKVRSKEVAFLRGEPINLNFLVSCFAKETHLFYNLLVFLDRVFSRDDLRGGALLDDLFRKTINGDEFGRSKFQRIFQRAYLGFFRMCKKWLLFGKIEDPFEEFFIKDTRTHLPFLSDMEVKYKPQATPLDTPNGFELAILGSSLTEDSRVFYFKNEAQDTSNWDNDFVLQLSLLPKTLVKVKTAKNILFIGKCLKVIQNKEGILGPTSQEMGKLVAELESYDSIGFVRTVQALKHIVSHNFMKLLLQSPDLKANLVILRDFFLLFKNEFYTIFTEEMSSVMCKGPDKYSEAQINKKLLPNCLIRLGIPGDEAQYSKLKFLLKAKGFSYKHFKEITNLRLCGNVEQKFSSLRLKSADNLNVQSVSEINQSSIWNLVLQNVQQGFDCVLSFRYIANPRSTKSKAKSSSVRRSAFRLCLQSDYDVRSSKQALSLTSVSKLKSALFFEFGFTESFEFDEHLQAMTKKTKSYLEIRLKNAKFPGEKVIHSQQMQNHEMNFADQDIVYVRIQNAQKKAKVYVSNENFLQTKGKEFVGSAMEFPLDLDEMFLLKK